ncbi:MAG: DUF1572 family protein [Leeuwenhoekiella sp.]|uniref:DUF1572 family protein n=1 Tax=Leeuwenhoekiella sp. TaxID=1977054 RepID=UPI003242B4C3|tara:strand:- start:2614 stop:3084 length:471 start_codon:yes stop_codon:yes gene_type:complete
MSQAAALAQRLQEVILEGTWIANTNFKKELDNTALDEVSIQIKTYNTVAILAQHVHYYIAGVKQVFLGGELSISDRFSFDFEPMQNDEAWHNFLALFWKDTEELVNLIKTLTDDQLDAIFVKEAYGSYKRNIEALIEHSYYHLGQIVLQLKTEATA